MVDIELLYFDECPSWHKAWEHLGRALVDTGVEANVRLRNIRSLSEAELHGFAGSPTLRVDGRDLEGYEGPVVIACRVYLSNRGVGWPSVEQIGSRLGAAIGRDG